MGVRMARFYTGVEYTARAETRSRVMLKAALE
jgi:hypothetical protein